MDHEIDAILRKIADEVMNADERPLWLTTARRAYALGREHERNDQAAHITLSAQKP